MPAGLARSILAVMLLMLAAPAAAQTVRVYSPQHRAADELAPIVATALGGDGRAVADRRTNSLVLTGSPRAVGQALALLAALDVRPRTVVLRYESRSARDLAASGVSVRWRSGAGSLWIGDVSRPAGAAAVQIGVDGHAAQSTAKLSGELRIVEGGSGRLATGASIPVTSRRIERGRGRATVVESTRHVDVESGFEASPRVLRDGRVQLSLHPFDASARPDGAIARSSADTVLVLDPGSTVAIGGIARAQGESHGALADAQSSGGGDDSLLLVTVALE